MRICKIQIAGNHLYIDYFVNDEMKICGHITKIEFLWGGTNC